MLTTNGLNGFIQRNTRIAGLPLSHGFTHGGHIFLLLSQSLECIAEQLLLRSVLPRSHPVSDKLQQIGGKRKSH